jgi:hypothetical protein
VHGIEALKRSTQPTTTIPALESAISPDGQEGNRPCSYREYQMLHMNYLDARNSLCHPALCRNWQNAYIVSLSKELDRLQDQAAVVASTETMHQSRIQWQ